MARRRLVLAAFGTIAGAAVALACVGEDATVHPVAPIDGGTGSTTEGGATTGQDAVAQQDGPGTSAGDATPDQGGTPPPCRLSEPFQTPKPLDALNSNEDDGFLRFSADGQTAYFSRGDFNADADIYVAIAPTFENPIRLAGVNSTFNGSSCCSDNFPSVSPDGLEIFTYTNDGSGATIQRASRNLVTQAFQARGSVPGLEGMNLISPFLSYDGTSLYVRDLGDGSKFKQSRRVTGFQFNAPVAVLPRAEYAIVSRDESTIYYWESGLKVATRAGNTGPFGVSRLVTELAAYSAIPSYLSGDGCRLYFTSSHSGANKAKSNIWYADKPK